MGLSLIFGSVLLLFLSYKFVILPLFFSPLSTIPKAHFTSHLSNGWIILQRYRGRENRAIHNAHQRLGPIVRLGPKALSVNSADALKVIYSDRFDKDEFYAAFANYGQPNMFSMIQRKPHADRKRMFGSIYSKSSLQSSSVIRDLCQELMVARLLPIIEKSAVKGSPINMIEYSSAVYMDFISSFIFGVQNSANFLYDSEARKAWLARRTLTKGYGFWGMEFPLLTSWLARLGIHLEPPEINSTWDAIKDLCLEMIQKTEKSKEDLKSGVQTKSVVYDQFFNQLSSSSDKTSLSPLSESTRRLTVASELMDHIFAGTDTTSWTLAYLMHELSHRPDLQSSLRAELISLCPPILYPPSTTSQTSIMNSGLPLSRSIDSLPLLDAILMETLRLRPSVPGSQPRIAPPSEPSSPISICGYTNIPAGTRVSAQAYSLHRNTEVFPEPELWKPERWLGASQVEKDEMMRWFWAFGSGGRMCIGNHLALIELKFVVAAIYTNYTTKIIDDKDMEQLDSYSAGPKGEKLILQFEKVR
ncbi:putative cytochrome P450 [Hyaloscypha variabilis F]|uniref:Putative cytochrome P450 n=1 Tax=Hyaloscypha variabilis (strain UAMH 11265 / GT02V1 / F) TaxID=1149755 RepID=A0A2J6QUN0_HYAVF|nr:putative cytochrome P450 [Hyaloscypha variabilis F]